MVLFFLLFLTIIQASAVYASYPLFRTGTVLVSLFGGQLARPINGLILIIGVIPMLGLGLGLFLVSYLIPVAGTSLASLLFRRLLRRAGKFLPRTCLYAIPLLLGTVNIALFDIGRSYDHTCWYPDDLQRAVSEIALYGLLALGGAISGILSSLVLRSREENRARP